MNWNSLRTATRKRHAGRYDDQEAALYAETVGNLSEADQDAYLADIRQAIPLTSGMRVLDVGAGSGAVCEILARLPGLSVTALEPSASMLAILKTQPTLDRVECVAGHCDSPSDHNLFGADCFDVIISRQVFNGLFDPIVAFENWFYWLGKGGFVVLIDGLYGRDAWRGQWSADVDALPMAATQSMATAPYLLEHVGFEIVSVDLMSKTNERPATRTPRYLVVAKKAKADE